MKWALRVRVCQNDGIVELWGHCVQCQKCNMLTTKSDMARHVRTSVARVNYATSPLIRL